MYLYIVDNSSLSLNMDIINNHGPESSLDSSRLNSQRSEEDLLFENSKLKLALANSKLSVILYSIFKQLIILIYLIFLR